MRVIIKPAGIFIIIAVMSILSYLAYVRSRVVPATNVPSTTASATAATAPVTVGDALLPANILVNGGFEGAFVKPVPNLGAKGVVSGTIGSGWLENSDWGPIHLEYSQETVRPHSGLVCQRARIGSLTDVARMQLVQQVPGILGKTYSGKVWVRTSGPKVPIFLILRHAAEPFTEYNSTIVEVGTEWKQISVEAKSTLAGEIYFMVCCAKPESTIWIDDASLEIVR